MPKGKVAALRPLTERLTSYHTRLGTLCNSISVLRYYFLDRPQNPDWAHLAKLSSDIEEKYKKVEEVANNVHLFDRLHHQPVVIAEEKFSSWHQGMWCWVKNTWRRLHIWLGDSWDDPNAGFDHISSFSRIDWQEIEPGWMQDPWELLVGAVNSYEQLPSEAQSILLRWPMHGWLTLLVFNPENRVELETEFNKARDTLKMTDLIPEDRSAMKAAEKQKGRKADMERNEAILDMWNAKTMSQEQIAQKYGVTSDAIKKLLGRMGDKGYSVRKGGQN